MTAQARLQLGSAPIIEAIFDVRCDLPPGIHRGAFHSAAQKAFGVSYPEFSAMLVHEQKFAIQPGKEPKAAARQTVIGYQLLSRDKKQVIQARFDGFGFNRLAPYTSLDDYLPEIRRNWDAYREFATPVVVRRIGLRYINRLSLPLDPNGKVSIGTFLRKGPSLPTTPDLPLMLTGFMHHQQFADLASGNEGNIILAAQPPAETLLPVIIDIEAFRKVELSPADWGTFEPIVASLRDLKNHLFKYTLTEECLNSFR